MGTSDYAPDPVKLAAFAEAFSIAEDCVRALVLDELKATILPEFEAQEAAAAEKLREAAAALEGPGEALADVDEEITRVRRPRGRRSWIPVSRARGSLPGCG